MKNNWLPPEYPKDIKLLGGFTCSLTNKEVNKWQKYIFGTNEFKALCELKLKTENVIRLRLLEDSDINDIIAEEMALETILFNLAEIWYAKIVAERNMEEGGCK